MRDLLADFVAALHRAYLDQARHLPPAERAGLPLVTTDPVTVVVAASRDLHVLATSRPMPAPEGQEVEIADSHAGVAWVIRFYDAALLPGLGLVPRRPDGSDDPAQVRRALGVAEVIYHVSLSPGGGLTAHHAQHAGVALANQHAAAHREVEELRHRYPRVGDLVDELAVATRVGLVHAVGLLARQIVGPDVALPTDPIEVRKELLRLARQAEGGTAR